MENKAPITPFDWQRLFFGDQPFGFYFEIAFRTLLMYLALLLLLRMLSKRTLTQLSILEFGIVIALGSAAGDPTFYEDIPVLHGLVVLVTVVLIQRAYTWLIRKNEMVETLMEGRPVELMRDGCILGDALDKGRISQEEFFEMLRQHQVTQLGEVRRAYLEQNGQVSVFTLAKPVPGLPIAPPWDLEPPERLSKGHSLDEATEVACCQCGRVERMTGLLQACGSCKYEDYLVAKLDPLELGKSGDADERGGAAKEGGKAQDSPVPGKQ